MDAFRDLVHHATQDMIVNRDNADILARTLWTLAGSSEPRARYMLYEFICEYRVHPQMRVVTEQLARGEMMWSHPNMRSIRTSLDEQDRFIEAPPEIEEGVIQCTRCGSNRTMSYSKQTRRGDESTTVFVRCSQCSKTFRL